MYGVFFPLTYSLPIICHSGQHWWKLSLYFRTVLLKWKKNPLKLPRTLHSNIFSWVLPLRTVNIIVSRFSQLLVFMMEALCWWWIGFWGTESSFMTYIWRRAENSTRRRWLHLLFFSIFFFSVIKVTYTCIHFYYMFSHFVTSAACK